MNNYFSVFVFTTLLLSILTLNFCFAQQDALLIKIYFPAGKATLTGAAVNELKNFVTKHSSEQHINIAGRGDRHGSDALNDSLSVKRALAVKQFLIANQFPREHIHAIIGYGRRNPVESSPPYVDSTLTGATATNASTQGYYYTYSRTNANQYTLFSSPAASGTTGTRNFFVNESGVVRLDSAGGKTIE